MNESARWAVLDHRGLARYRNSPFSIINSQLLLLLLLVFSGELLHEVDQVLNAFDRHRVVDGSAHTADRTMALEVGHTGWPWTPGELRVQLVAVCCGR